MDIVNFDALKAQDRIIDPSQVDPEEDYFIIGKYTNHYTTNSMKYTKYPVFAIKAGDVMGTLPSYKVYSAILNQTGTDAPTAIVLENTLGVPFTWYYDSQGNYYIEATSNVFFENKTVLVPGVINFVALNSSGYLANKFFITTLASNPMIVGYSPMPLDDLLNNTFIEIRVYN
jgi:hypothetical protein